MTYDAVLARAGQQVPQADHAILRACAGRGGQDGRGGGGWAGGGLTGVDEGGRDGAAMAVQGEDVEVVVQAEGKMMYLAKSVCTLHLK